MNVSRENWFFEGMSISSEWDWEWVNNIFNHINTPKTTKETQQGQFRKQFEFPIHPFNVTICRQRHKAFIDEHNNGVLVHPSFWYDDVMWPSLLKAMSLSMPPHRQGFSPPMGHTLRLSIDTPKAVCRQPLGIPYGTFCGALCKLHPGVAEVNKNINKSRTFLIYFRKKQLHEKLQNMVGTITTYMNVSRAIFRTSQTFLDV